jgi:hypothetical protein
MASGSIPPRFSSSFTRGETPDLVLTADPGAEKPDTYEYQAMMAAWMAARGIPYEVVAYRPKRFKHYPPYATILTNLLANATLPSISLGRHSCSLKWKVAPQDAFLKQWPPAKAAWGGPEGRAPDRLRCLARRRTPLPPCRRDRRPAVRVPLSAARLGLDARTLRGPDCASRPAGPAQVVLLVLMFADGVSSHRNPLFMGYKIIRRLRRSEAIEALGTVAKRYCTLQLSRAQPPKAVRLVAAASGMTLLSGRN